MANETVQRLLTLVQSFCLAWHLKLKRFVFSMATETVQSLLTLLQLGGHRSPQSQLLPCYYNYLVCRLKPTPPNVQASRM
jgi:hypothetical protein